MTEIETNTEKLLTELTDLTLLDADGADVPIASLWQDERGVFVFIRHFG